MDSRARQLLVTLTLAALGALIPAVAEAQPPTFGKAFEPSTIGPGSISTLVFTITNPATTPAQNLAFTDTLPAAVVLATPASPQSSCGGTVSAPSGGTTISYSGGAVGGMSTCTIQAHVTSATPGMHMNVAGDLTSNAGNSGSASANLTVATDRPAFTKSFSPASVPFGERSTLTFLIDNSLNVSTVASLSFTDPLPSGMTVADPANASTDCGTPPFNPTLSADPGATVVDFTSLGIDAFPAVGPGGTCSVVVDVVGGAVGALDNVSDGLLATVQGAERTSGKAGAVLTVTGGASEPIQLRKELVDDPVPPGGTVTLRLTVTNSSRDEAASAITFSDDLDAALTGLVATGLPVNDVCGVGSQLSGTSLVTLSGGSLAPGASCTFTVTLAVPASATGGTYVNSTTTVTATVGGNGVTGSAASDLLFVVAAPLLTKEFTDDPVGAGGTVTLELTITNTSSTSAATDITFFDELDPIVTGASAIPAPGFCGPGSTATFFPGEPAALQIAGASLDPAGTPGDFCTFSLILNVSAAAGGGVYPNTTSAITATVDGGTRTGRPASDDLVVVGAPRLEKAFDNPAAAGSTVLLHFTLSHDALAPDEATGIAFTDDLGAVLSGLVSTSGTLNDVCGLGSAISGSTVLSFTGGRLAPGETCTFSVVVAVPAGALPGSYTNTTSTVSATVGALTVSGSAAENDLQVAGLVLRKEFTDDPTIAGDTVTLQFVLDNLSGSAAASGIGFTDNLNAALSGLAVAAPLPLAPCGGSLSGTSFLTYTGGSVAANDSCSFTVTLQVPAGAADGDYLNVTSSVGATVNGSPVVLDPATDTLTVDSSRLAIAKSFTDDPALPGGGVTLELTITNLDPSRPVDDVAFQDDLDAALTGLEASSALFNDCGGMATSSFPTGSFGYAGGLIPAGDSCTIRLAVDVPPGPLPGSSFLNTTSDVTGTIDGLPVSGPPASDTLRVFSLTLHKSFDGPTAAGGTAVLSFTIENLDSSSGISDLAFFDNLASTVSGLAAVAPLPASPCGPGSQLAGTTFLTLTGGSLGPGGICSFDVTVQVPASASPGTRTNTTGDLSSQGQPVAAPASDDLLIEPPPAFSKSFAPAAIEVGQVSTLTFTIDNSGSGLPASDLAFDDNLPGLVVATPLAVANTCGGTLTAVAGSGVVSLSGGTVAGGASCTISVAVTASAEGSHLNTTGDLTSSSGNSGAASATLEVRTEAAFTKTFLSNPVLRGGLVELQLTLTNPSPSFGLTNLTFSDDLGAALSGLAAIDNPQSDVCGAGSQLTGTTVLTLTGGSLAPGASCTFSTTLQVPAGAGLGTFTNLTGPVTGDAGGEPFSTPPASDDLEVAFLGLTKSFTPAEVAVGGITSLSFTITNSDPNNGATGISFSDDLGAVIPGLVAIDTPLTDPCGAGSALAGTSVLTLTGGSLGPGGSCSFTVTVQVPASASSGTFTNLTTALQAVVAGNAVADDAAGAASAALTVSFQVLAIPTASELGLLLLVALLAAAGLWFLRRSVS